jgi:hypothetical protein
VLRGKQHREHRISVAIGTRAPSPAEDAITLFPQDLEAAIPISVEPTRKVHSPAPPSSRLQLLELKRSFARLA